MIGALVFAAAGCFGPATQVDVVPDRANSLAIEGDVLYCGADSSLYVFDVPCGYQGLLRIVNCTSEMKGEKSK